MNGPIRGAVFREAPGVWVALQIRGHVAAGPGSMRARAIRVPWPGWRLSAHDTHTEALDAACAALAAVESR